MQKLLIMFLLATLLLGLSCTKNEPMEPVSNNPNLKIVWKKPFNIGELAGSQTPLITDNGAMFTLLTSFKPEELWMFDKNTGEIKWRWQGVSGDFSVFSQMNPLVVDNNLNCVTGGGFLSINLTNGTEACRYDLNNLVWSARLGDALVSIEDDLSDTIVNVTITDKNCNKKLLFTEVNTATPYWGLVGLVPYVNEDGDTLVYYCTEKYFWGIDTAETYFICRNISKDSIIHKVFSPKGHMLYSPIILGDNIILAFENIITCLNRKTFAKVWEQDIEGGPGSQINIYDGKLIVPDDKYGYHYALDPTNGKILWKTKTGERCSMAQYSKGHIYFVCKSTNILHAIRMSDGKKIWEEKSPDTEQNSGTGFAFGAGVDPITNRVYISTLNNAYCFKGIE
jgi:outer membrane protein assembly factor BamB